MASRGFVPLVVSLAVLAASPASASFHLMKIEQAIGGVGGATAQQAIQLRMRANGQNLVSQARLRAWDATGANPVTLIAFPSDVATGVQGRRVLVVSAAFAAAQPAISADFTMTNTIPPSYLAAGRLTFEDTVGTIYWSLAWGGAGYTGSHTGSTFNDADGNFGPAFGSALPSGSTQALLFSAPDPAGAALSTTNLADYSVTAGAAVFTNNAGAAGTVVIPPPQADLSITKTDSPDPVVVLQPLTYTLAVSNAGPQSASSVSVSDTLPAAVVFQTASGTGWICTEGGGLVTCTRPSLAVGAAPDITLTVTAPAIPTTLTNTATVTASTADPSSANNTDSEDTTVIAAPTLADLSITKSDAGQSATWGLPLTYTLVASNAGPAAAPGAIVADDFPTGLSSVSWTCVASGGSSCPANGTGIILTSVVLAVGGTTTFTATGTVAVGTAGPLVNTATVTAPVGITDPNTANNSATETTPLASTSYYSLAPCRVADTRGATGASGGPALRASDTRLVPVAGLCGIPLDARAVAVTLTVVQPTAGGNLRLFPAGTALPTASAINFAANQVRGNNAIIPVGAGGEIAVRCVLATSPGSTHFVLDVFGYFR